MQYDKSNTEHVDLQQRNPKNNQNNDGDDLISQTVASSVGNYVSII